MFSRASRCRSGIAVLRSPTKTARKRRSRLVTRCVAKRSLGVVNPSPPESKEATRARTLAVDDRLASLRAVAAGTSQKLQGKSVSAAVAEIDALVTRRARRQKLVSKLDARRVAAGNVSWAVRSAVSVCLSAVFVLDGHIIRQFSHGYGIWALITCVNCNEKIQGDLLRKSLERALGTLVGGLAAIAVLFFDDYLVPEILGWNARAEFYLFDVAAFTVAGVYLRASNRSSPTFDYSYFLAVLTFDFLLLDSFSDANQYLDSVERILMVCCGGLITCAVGVVLFPQYAGQELMAVSAGAFEGSACLLEVTASSLVMSCSAREHGPSARPPPIPLPQVRRMADLARYELRFFPPPEVAGQGWGRGIPRAALQLDWSLFTEACEAAQELRQLCESVNALSDLHYDDVASGSAPSQSVPYDVELIVAVEEAAKILRDCSDRLRDSCKRAARRDPASLPRVTYTNSVDFDEEVLLSAFDQALIALDERLIESEGCACTENASDRTPPPAPLAGVRLLACRLRMNLTKCVAAVRNVESAGLLDTPLPFPPTLR